MKVDYQQLADQIRCWAGELGFQQTGISAIDLDEDEGRLNDWLAKGMHGEMHYMSKHGTKRSRPQELVPGTVRVIAVRMDYFPPQAQKIKKVLADSGLAFVSRHATGRDYHKIIRTRLQKLADRIKEKTGEFGYRAFVDSAPVLERALARNADLGWIGKHTNLINPKAGSWFFLGELYTDLPLPVDEPFVTDHCGSCDACMEICPTGAIIAPYKVDARRCISYLTIELRSSIPLEFRKAMGNRIYGCDDCQLVCPWNKFSRHSTEEDFNVRHGLDNVQLVDLFNWSEDEFLKKMEGSTIRRIGYECWLRNIAVALGNAETSPVIVDALKLKLDFPSEMVREHVQWALDQHNN